MPNCQKSLYLAFWSLCQTGFFSEVTEGNDPITMTLAGANVKLKGKGTSMASFEGINGDGLDDIVVHVNTTALQLTLGDTEAVLEGQTFDGLMIRGVDSVRIVRE